MLCQPTVVLLVPLNDWDLRKVVNDPERMAEFDDFSTFFFETASKQIKDEHNKRKSTGGGAITQVVFLIDVKNYPYTQLMSLGGMLIHILQ